MNNSSGYLIIWFFGVHEGDSIGGRFPRDGGYFLIDVPDAEIIKSFFGSDRQFSFIIISHSDSDHLGGLYDLIENYNYEAASLYINFDRGPSDPASRCYMDILRRLHGWKLDGKIKASSTVDTGTTIPSPINIEVLHPSHSFLGKMCGEKKHNDASVVIKMAYCNKSVIFAGDIQMDGINEIIRAHTSCLKCDLLKIPHHGSYPRNKTIEDLIKETNPTYAVICASPGNRFGHPDPKLVDLLRTKGIKLYCVGKNEDNTTSTITVSINDTELRVEP